MTEVSEVLDALWRHKTIDGVKVSDSIRIDNSNLIIDFYKQLTNDQLSYLSDYVLYRGNSKGKASSFYTDEYPYLTDSQLLVRYKKECSMIFASNYDTTNNNNTISTRKNNREVSQALNEYKWRLSETNDKKL